MSLSVTFFLFIAQVTAVFFLTKATINQLFYFLRRLNLGEKTIFILISLLFLPGTILHELSHFFAAIILFLKVKDVQIFPEFKENEIKLGHVLYEKKDFLRSILVGIAPFFGALFFFFLLSFFHLFPANNFWQNLFFGYLIFAVSSSMFSSKQDLVDLIYIVPTIFFLAGIIYIFDLKIDIIFKNKHWLTLLSSFLSKINFYLFLSLVTNLLLTLSLSLLKKR